MPEADGSTLALAARLRRLDDARLETLIRRRRPALARVDDYFDLADALLHPENLQLALTGLDRPTLIVVATVAEHGAVEVDWLHEALHDDPALAEHIAAAIDLALLDSEDGHLVAPDPLPAVLAGWPARGLPSRRDLVSTTAPVPIARAVDNAMSITTDRLAAEHAFATVGAITELLIELRRQPARPLPRRGYGLPDGRRLAEAMHVDLDSVPVLHEIATFAGLIALDDGLWSPTALAEHWRSLPRVERWRQLAEAWLDRLPIGVRDVLGARTRTRWDDRLVAAVEWLYPADRERIRSSLLSERRLAEVLGIGADGWPSSAGGALLAGQASAAATAMAAHFPAEVGRVYVQHDLTVIAPGPLEARIDAHLRRMAEPREPGIASTYRITPGSLTRAVAAGETPESMRSLLERISLTGIPQPLDYLITEAGERYGAVRVSEADPAHAEPHGRGHPALSVVRSDDPTLIAAMAVDRQLSALTLRQVDQHHLESRYEPTVVFWALSDARYPVALEDAAGTALPPAPRPIARRSTAEADPVPALVRRLRERALGEPPDTERAWIARQLDLAIKARLTVTVTVRLPNGSSIDYVLEPAALNAGRLRARDRRLGVERTLPLSHITSVGPAPAEEERR